MPWVQNNLTEDLGEQLYMYGQNWVQNVYF
jgi:hypothetical protein